MSGAIPVDMCRLAISQPGRTQTGAAGATGRLTPPLRDQDVGRRPDLLRPRLPGGLHMISRDSVRTLIGGSAYGSDGDKIGSIGQVYLDNASGEPAWVTVKTGLFGSNESFVPLAE